MAKTSIERFEHVMDLYFSGPKLGEGLEELVPWADVDKWRIAFRILTYSKIKWAILRFYPYEDAGDDGIFLVMLQGEVKALEGSFCGIYILPILQWNTLLSAWKSRRYDNALPSQRLVHLSFFHRKILNSLKFEFNLHYYDICKTLKLSNRTPVSNVSYLIRD